MDSAVKDVLASTEKGAMKLFKSALIKQRARGNAQHKETMKVYAEAITLCK
jgi:hypothetical protein